MAVRAVDPAASIRERTTKNLLDAEKLDADARQHDVRDGIERADLVEADGLDGRTVDLGLGHGDRGLDHVALGGFGAGAVDVFTGALEHGVGGAHTSRNRRTPRRVG